MRYEASVNGAPAKPMSGTRPPRARRTRRTVSNTNPTASRTSTGFRRATSSALRTGRWICGPSPRANSRPTPSGSSTSKMSANRMAASTPSRSTGWRVTSHAASGVLQRSRNAYRARKARYSGM